MLVDNRWLESAVEIKEAAVAHFQNQFKARTLHRPQLPGDIFEKQISTVDNEVLGARFTEEEIKRSAWSCDSNKSPCPDGFPFAFIKANWENMKIEVMQMMEEFFEKGKIVRGYTPLSLSLFQKKRGVILLRSIGQSR